MRVVHVICGGQSPEQRHAEIQDDIMEWEKKQELKGRHSESSWFKTKEEALIQRQKEVLNFFHNEISRQRNRIAQLERELEQFHREHESRKEFA
jgi:predicted RNase H-like nuclease (RuvC/YqgF family)